MDAPRRGISFSRNWGISADPPAARRPNLARTRHPFGGAGTVSASSAPPGGNVALRGCAVSILPCRRRGSAAK